MHCLPSASKASTNQRCEEKGDRGIMMCPDVESLLSTLQDCIVFFPPTLTDLLIKLRKHQFYI